MLYCLVAVLDPTSCTPIVNTTLYYYTRPNTSSHDDCPSSNPCYTISEYEELSANGSCFIYDSKNPDVVMMFLPGEHILVNTFSVKGAQSFTMTCADQNSETCLVDIQGTLRITSVPDITFIRLSFTNHGLARKESGSAIQPSLFMSLSLTACEIVHFDGNFLRAEKGNVTIRNTSIIHNNVTGGDGLISQVSIVIHVEFGCLNLINNTVIYNHLVKSTLVATYLTTVLIVDCIVSENVGMECRHPLLNTTLGTTTLRHKNIFTQNQLFLWLIVVGDAYLEDSVLFSSNSASGGPVAAVGMSSLYFTGNTTFHNNTASIFGGAMALSSATVLHIWDNATLLLSNNTALNRGGAIFVDNNRECLFPNAVLCFLDIAMDTNSTVIFRNNNAAISGDDIFGGENCSNFRNNSHIEIYHEKESLSSIASDPRQLCLCNDEGILCCPHGGTYPNEKPVKMCSLLNKVEEVFPGETVTLRLLAAAEHFGATPSGVLLFNGNGYTDVNAPLFRQQISNKREKHIGFIRAKCTNITIYPNYSKRGTKIISLYPSKLCKLQEPLVIEIPISPVCPPGFDISQESNTCVCARQLQNPSNVFCNISEQTIQHRGNIWVGYQQNMINNSGIVIHSSPCPFDYCVTGKDVVFTLNSTDQQCQHYRTGLLCGQCREGLSVVLGGSSRCQKCSNSYLALLLPFSLAGIALLLLLFLLKFTVNYGTLSGLIFYANIVQANRTFLLPRGETNVFTIFIAWLNLDLGIETCFFDGMDSYLKTWLQFAFPLYIWLLCFLIIFLSNRSTRVTKIFGSNPIAVLATLFLLSYLKMFRTMLIILSIAILDYSDGHKNIVWLHDANVNVRTTKYLILLSAVIAVMIFLFIPYTIILLFGQWLQSYSHIRLLSWGGNQKLRALLDPYNAPYKDKHRYWTGFLLLFRIFLAIGNAFTLASDRSISNQTFVISSSILAIVLVSFVWGWFAGGLYKNRILDLLEISFLVNIALLFHIVAHNKEVRSDTSIAVYTSIGVALAIFAGILIFHVWLVVRTWSRIQTLQQYLRAKISPSRQSADNAPARKKSDTNINQHRVKSFSSPWASNGLRESLLEEEVVL